MKIELRPIQSRDDWHALHKIRREVLFSPRRHSQPYDDKHPDDRAEGNIPYLLLADAEPVGTMRLDLRGQVAALRLVAIAEKRQGRGFGRALSDLTDAEARRLGARLLHVNAAPDAVGYYENMGWRLEAWDPSELVGIAANCVQMTKTL